MKTKNEKSSSKEEQQDEKIGTIDQIKKKYGFSKSGNVSINKSLHVLYPTVLFLSRN